MQAERLFGPLPLTNRLGCSWSAFPETLEDLTSVETDVDAPGDRQAHSSPFSGGFFALTPSQSYLTGFSDRSTGLFGSVEEAWTANDTETSYYLVRRRGDSATGLTPSTPGISEGGSLLDVLIGDASEVKTSPEEQRSLLHGISGQSKLKYHLQSFDDFTDLKDPLTPYSLETQCTKGQATSINASNSAYVALEVGQMPTLSTYTSDQSQQEARPWSIFASQPHDGQILPDNITNEGLSFQFQQCFAHTAEFTSPEKPSRAIIKPKNQLSSEHHQHARRKHQKHKSRKPPRDTAQRNLRIDRGALNTAGRSVASPATSATSTNSTTGRGGRQEGYHLPELDRISAHGVRDQGSCFRCFCMKEKCSHKHSPCDNCSRVLENGRFRIWKTPCTFKKLSERCEYLVPASLASQLAVPEMRAFLYQHVGKSSGTFLLHLSIGFGEIWIFKAVEIFPGNHELHQMFGFHPQVNVETDSQSPVPLTNPPVVPLWINPLQMQISIDCWLDKTIEDPQADWQSHWFPDPSQTWQLNILYAICQHYQCCKPGDNRAATTAHQTLKWALKMSVLNYVMGHAFLVPEDEVDLLFQHLENPHFKGPRPEGNVCPRAANKFVKMMAVPVMHVVSEKTLSGLHELFRAEVPHTAVWDSMFAIVVLCLMVTSSTQRSLMQRALVCVAKHDSSFSREDAVFDAQIIDEELVVHLIGMFHDKFRTLSKNKGFNPLGAMCNSGQQHFSPFATWVKTVTERHFRLNSSNSLSNMGAERLLAKFMQPFLPTV